MDGTGIWISRLLSLDVAARLATVGRGPPQQVAAPVAFQPLAVGNAGPCLASPGERA